MIDSSVPTRDPTIHPPPMTCPAPPDFAGALHPSVPPCQKRGMEVQREIPVPPSPDRRDALSVTMVDASDRESKMSVQRMAELLNMRMNGQNPTSIQESLGVFAEPARVDDHDPKAMTSSRLTSSQSKLSAVYEIPALDLESLVLDENMAGSYGDDDEQYNDAEDSEGAVEFEDYVFGDCSYLNVPTNLELVSAISAS